ncbi:P-loop NTPase fold protein [Streptomyces sp. NPDC059575]|uniref:P-loop NTPase fold protein n=1 Tax=Streptomyces sp. NPDC059575 TaxID=3346872 RepID=UPI0036AE2130
MQLSWKWLEPVKLKAAHFAAPERANIYAACLEVSLLDPHVAGRLGKRPGATHEAVVREMHKPRWQAAAIDRAAGPTRRAYDLAAASTAQIRGMWLSAVEAAETNWLITCGLFGLASIGLAVILGWLALLGVVLGAAAAMLTLVWWPSGFLFHRRLNLLAGWYCIVWLFRRYRLGVHAARWGFFLETRGTRPLVEHVVLQLLGDDPDSVYIPSDTDGLRAPRAPAYIVSNSAMKQLKRKLAHIDEGTIAVCGPRGTGKSTLLETCVEDARFGVLVQAPAAYAPLDFLVSLFVRVCVEYIRGQGYPVPELTRLSPMLRLARTVRRWVKQVSRWSAFALPALALFCLGLSAPVRSLYEKYASTVADFLRQHGSALHKQALSVWNGHAIGLGVVICLVALVWWHSRQDLWPAKLLGRLWTRHSTFLGGSIVAVSLGSVFADERMRHQFTELPEGTLATCIGLLGLWLVLHGVREVLDEPGTPLGGHNTALILRPPATTVGGYLLYLLVTTPQTNQLLSDPQNPVRLCGALAGVLIVRAGYWRLKPVEPALVTRCRNYLYRLQTIQTTASTWSGTAPQLLAIGGSHSTTVSTMPPTMPELVAEFRELLGDIAEGKTALAGKVVIAIDEVDRLGSDREALEFLREIKAILGVRHVHYLISVAEDVGATFVRRGLPHRDVTDSSLDDIIHVPPSMLAESHEILSTRSKTLTEPYTLLAHSLSGGILRDLLRYGLQIKETQDRTQAQELPDIAYDLILDELSETLAGFRTLLSKHQWTPGTSDTLTAFRFLCNQLRDVCPCTEPELRQALGTFVFEGVDSHADPAPDRELSDEARQLVDEASAYAYFSLTLLEVFGEKGLKHRASRARAFGADGAPERLAEARQELAISPYSARTLINSIRMAWELPLSPASRLDLPAPRRARCSRHHARL